MHMMPTSNIRVRFPPSPTGYCHVGTARMALVNYLFARKNGGSIVFRSEDTDKVRSTREFEDDILEQLRWLGLSWEIFYRSTEVLDRHVSEMQKLIDQKKAYISTEESKKEPDVMVDVVRLRNASKIVTFSDVVRGDISVDTSDLGDFIIGRSLRDPLYNFAVVVDDAADRITHVIRGEDHISNTPRQILIQEALGYSRPIYAHFPLHLAPDRSKLSKRKGEVAVRAYREQGYLPEALANYLSILGWTLPSEREVLSLPEMIDEFELQDLHKSGAVFDIEKLRWFNRQYLDHMDIDAFTAYAENSLAGVLQARDIPSTPHALKAIMPVLKERIHCTADIESMVGAGELDFFFVSPILESARIPEKNSNASDARRHLAWLSEALTLLHENDWSYDAIKNTTWTYACQEGRGNVLWPLRYALSGREKSPDPFIIASTIGKDETLMRIAAALQVLVV